MEQYNHWRMQPAENINAALQALPKAVEKEVLIVDSTDGESYHGKIDQKHKAIMVNGNIVDIPSNRYVLKQHEEAFRPIVDGLTVSGVQDFQFALWSTPRKANLNIFVGEATDGVKFGFKCTNSFDRSLSINFGANAYQKTQNVELVKKQHVLVWGFREVCSNGMVIKVPLKTTEYLDAVEVTKIKSLLSEHGKIKHMGNVDTKLEQMQYVVEAFLLLKNPLDKMIIDAQNHPLTKEEAREMIKKYVGRRRQDKYLELYGMEEQSLWGLYNSLTFFASHDESISTSMRESLLMNAADMLEKELLEKPIAVKA